MATTTLQRWLMAGTPRLIISLSEHPRCLRLVLSAVVVVFAQLPHLAWAEVNAQLAAASTKVEVGRPLRVELTVSSDEGAAESPRLTIPTGLSLRGPSISTRFSTSINGWSATMRRELGATWEVTATKVGVYTIGPAQAFVDGKAVTTNTLTVEVVAQGTLPPEPQPNNRRRPRSLFDDDDFFSNFPGMGRPGRSPLDDLIARQADLYPEAPAEFQQATASDPTAFLVASVSPERAVVGQQVTLRIIAYGAVGRFRETDSREPRRPDFFSVPITESSEQQQMFSVRIGETDYLAVKVREFALFPLKPGKLEIGPMKMAFYGSNYISRSSGKPIERESQPVVIDVTEPPVTGRPLDYRLGDVGRFKLSATVDPRTVREGDSFSVIATLSGEGRLPESLSVPEQTGLEWLSPTITEQHKINKRRRLEGQRTFTYIVKATRSGTIDLGNLHVAYFDPGQAKYASASASLGKLVVEPAANAAQPGATVAPTPAPPDVKLSELARPRVSLRPFTSQNPWTKAAWLWPLMLGLPFAVVLAQLGGDRLRLFLRRRDAARSSLSKRSIVELDAARKLHANNDESGVIASLERAIFLAIEDATGLKARGVLRDQLADELRGEGVDVTLARDLVQLLEALEAWRFTRQGDVGPLLDTAAKLVGQLRASARGRAVARGARKP
jgi:hypothetical protein